MNEYVQAALRRHMWFGSYTRSGELKNVQVWCYLRSGKIEFLTDGTSLKAKRAERNPRVVCFLGAENGPRVEGTAQIIRDPAELMRGYQAYWKTHPLMMLFLNFVIRKNIREGRQILVRITPHEPNLIAGSTDPKLAV
jgi:hypothetical protein